MSAITPSEGPRSKGPDSLRDVHWKTVRWVEVDTATVAFADGSVADLDPQELPRITETERSSQVVDLSDLGCPMVMMNTRENATYPVEVADEASAVRVELTNDVADVTGRWTRFTVLTLATPST
jgi:prepilin-type processing-associated H-X9-DG protein